MLDMAMIKESKFLARWVKQYQTIKESVLTKYGMHQVRTVSQPFLLTVSHPYGLGLRRIKYNLYYIRYTISGAQTDCIKPSFKQRYHDAYVAELHHFHDLINKPNVRFYRLQVEVFNFIQ